MHINQALERIKQLGTNGDNYDISTEDILSQIQNWHESLTIEILEVTQDAVTIHFKSLPADVKGFAQKIYEFCPDIIDQHFGCFAEMIEAMEETGEDLPQDLQNLLQGIDLSSEDSGLDLLEKALRTDGRVQLWWD